MLLVENTQPCVITIGDRLLIPGYNRFDPEEWASLEKEYSSGLSARFDDDHLRLNHEEVVTPTIVKKTYDLTLLAEWNHEKASAKVKKAIVDQLKLLERPVRNGTS